MITGYYVTQEGERFALVEQNETYRGRVILSGLTSERATKLYWRYMREWLKSRAKRERAPEPTLFPVKDDARPASQRKAAGRFAEPTLFEL